jgi:hypothetical protein
MKTRSGFVSNSSTSSFIAVTSKKGLDEIISLFEHPEDGEEKDINDEVVQGVVDLENGLDIFGSDDPQFYGLEFSGLIAAGETISLAGMKAEFAKIVWREYRIRLEDKDMQFEFGEVGSG